MRHAVTANINIRTYFTEYIRIGTVNLLTYDCKYKPILVSCKLVFSMHGHLIDKLLVDCTVRMYIHIVLCMPALFTPIYIYIYIYIYIPPWTTHSPGNPDHSLAEDCCC